MQVRGVRDGGSRGRRIALEGLAVAAFAVAVLAGCGVGPFASDGADGSTLASPGPSVTAPSEPSSKESPLLSGQLDPNSAVGTLATGFPADLLPVPPGAEVLVSSREPIAGSSAFQVSLNLRTTLSADAVIQFFRAPLTTAGFVEVTPSSSAAALAAQSTFTRSGGDELLVIGVLDRDNVRTVTIGGRLRSAS